MDKQVFLLNTKIISLITAICIGTIIFNGAIGSTAEQKFFDIDKQDIQKLLTHEESAWLLEHRSIRIAGPKAFPPFHYYEEDGAFKGMASDYINLIFKYLDIQPDIRSNAEWTTVLRDAEERKIDLISCSAKTIEREAYLGFTEPYLSFPLVIITKTDAPFIGGINDLHGRNVAFVKGAAAYDWIERDKVKAIPYFVKTPLDGLKSVSFGNAEAHIENLATAFYLIQKHGLANLKIAAPAFNENYNLYIAVRKDWPELVSIINKIFSVIIPQQHSTIRNRWLPIKDDYGIRKADVIKWILGISGIVITIFAVILMWNRRLSREIHEREQLENALSASERRFKELIRNSSDSITILDKNGLQIYVSDVVENMLGYKPSELINIPVIKEMIHPEDQELTQAAFLKIIQEGQGSAQYRHRHKNGSWVYLEAWGTNQLENPDIRGVVVSVRNITERRQAEKILKEIITKNPMSIQILDKEGLTLEVNPSYKLLFGGVPPSDYSIFNDLQLLQKGMGKIFDQLKNGEIVRFPELYFNAHDSLPEFPDVPAWVRTIGFPLEGISGKPERFVFMHENITDRILAEDDLKKSEILYRKMTENSPLGIHFYALNNNKQLVFVGSNPASDQLLGIDNSQFIGKTIEEAFPPLIQTELPDRYRDAAEKGISWSTDQIVYDDQKITGAFEVRIFQTTPGNMVAIFADITERKQAEAEKLIAQKNAGDNEKMALVGQIAGKMAHDFNNILGIIMGNTELALLDCKEPKTKKTLELIYEQTRRGKNLTRNLVAFAKDQEPKQEFFRISEKIDLVLNLMRKDLEGIELRKEESPGVPQLLADPGMIEHALVNLIQNAIHALSRAESPRITVRTYSRDNHICFEIEDNGCGISQDNLEHIYDPSFTLKGSRDVTGSYKAGIKGTGYGMSNVKKYIEQHKGSISIESESGSGTKFTINLPIIKKELTIEEKTEIRKGKAHFEKYILLVEDETAIADVQYRILTQEPCNHRVDIANNGQVAMDLFGRNKYDLVSLDYVLPGDINGMDIYHHIRSSDKTIPILFISGNIEFLESIKELKQKDTAIDHLSKPNQNKDYINSINGLFERAWAIQQ